MLEKLFDEKDPLAEQIAKLTKLAEDKVRELQDSDTTCVTDAQAEPSSTADRGDSSDDGQSCGCCSQ